LYLSTNLIISYLATFLGTNSLFVLMCRKAVNQSINLVHWLSGYVPPCFFRSCRHLFFIVFPVVRSFALCCVLSIFQYFSVSVLVVQLYVIKVIKIPTQYNSTNVSRLPFIDVYNYARDSFITASVLLVANVINSAHKQHRSANYIAN